MSGETTKPRDFQMEFQLQKGRTKQLEFEKEVLIRDHARENDRLIRIIEKADLMFRAVAEWKRVSSASAFVAVVEATNNYENARGGLPPEAMKPPGAR